MATKTVRKVGNLIDKSDYVYDADKVNQERTNLRTFYEDKYFNLFMDSYRCEGLTRDQMEYIFRKFWTLGEVGAFKVYENELTGEDESSYIKSGIGFAQLAPTKRYNMYGFPTHYHLVNEWDSPLVPNTELERGVNVAVGHISHCKKGVRGLVLPLIERLVDVEMTIRTNLKVHKKPIIMTVEPEVAGKADSLKGKILNDEEFIITGLSKDALSSINTSASYIIDKLYDYANDLDNQILTILSIDNTGHQGSRQQQLAVDQVNANNDLINRFGEIFTNQLKLWSEEIKNTLGVNINFESIHDEVMSEREEYDLPNDPGNQNALGNEGNLTNHPTNEEED